MRVTRRQRSVSLAHFGFSGGDRGQPPGDPTLAGLRTLPRPVAVVVGADGVLAAHIGVEYALEHHGFVPDMIIGTSAGALAGAIAPAHPDTACHSQRLISTACLTAGRFPDGLRVSGPGLYRVDDPSTTSDGPGEASISPIAGASL